ncbi:MAG: TMEM165/GDT1 family protein [Thermococcus sp.]|uniref:Membrane protein n=1 Tax=Thermococcus guaymasensis DSM 11113 TaxID=1432656 RepID=A0A0X1KIK7_9EURY|nr:TMEM165/GDT1 family protein [Thermococcus guaymasensis]AJC71080.1 membrane protein [Thermococcus guaymasensis DSM 11113]MCD6523623.1 TMEM165/GDT1 family protein [Thermococcus sp.]
MDPLIYIFITVFLAELGDKTQLATMAFATKYGWKTAFAGALLGLALINLLGAVVGEKLGNILPQDVIHRAAGVLFVIIGVLMFAGKI